MKRIVRLSAGVVAVLIVAGVLFALMLDGVTRRAIELNAETALDVRTTLDNAGIKLFGRQLDLHRLDVSNPEGFDGTPRFLRLGHASTDLSLFDLPRERIELQQLTLEDIEVHLDRSGGRANYRVILDNIKQHQEQRDPDRQKDLFIREIVLRDITVHVRLLPIGGELTRLELAIPEIVLENVGSGDDGISTSQLVSVITTSLLAAIFQRGADVLPDVMLEELGKAIAAVGDLGDFGLTIAGETFHGAVGLIGTVAEELGAVGEDIIEGVGDTLRGVGELFGGNRNRD